MGCSRVALYMQPRNDYDFDETRQLIHPNDELNLSYSRLFFSKCMSEYHDYFAQYFDFYFLQRWPLETVLKLVLTCEVGTC